MEGGKGGAGVSIPQTTVAVLRKYGTDNRLAKQTALSEAVPSLRSVAGSGLGDCGLSSKAVVDPRWWQREAVSYISHIRFY